MSLEKIWYDVKHYFEKLTIKRLFERILFNVRWILIAFYLRLVLQLIYFAYCVWFSHDIYKDSDHEIHMIELVDFTMIANLVELIITGSYHSFVARDHGYPNKNNSSGTLKMKMMTSMMGIVAVSQLKFVLVGVYNKDTLIMSSCVFLMFCIGAIVLSVVDYLHVKTEIMEHKIEEKNHKQELDETNHNGNKPENRHG